jgi:hypothetical protein
MKHDITILRAAIRQYSRGRKIVRPTSNHVVLSKDSLSGASAIRCRPPSTAAVAANISPRFYSYHSPCKLSANSRASGAMSHQTVTITRQLSSANSNRRQQPSQPERRGRRVWKSLDHNMTIGRDPDADHGNDTTGLANNDYWDTTVDNAKHGRMLHESLMRICEQVRTVGLKIHSPSPFFSFACFA